MKSNHRKRGFTLVEILVTITIIVALAGMTFLVASRAKKSAVSAKTINNLREIGVAVGLWSADNNNCYPACWNNSLNRSYAQALDPYMHSVELYRSLDSKFIGPNKRIPVKVNGYSHPMTYSMNPAVSPDTSNGGSLIRAAQVGNPAGVILMADGCQNPGNLGQSSASAHRLANLGSTGTMALGNDPIPVGTDVDTSSGDGWFRYDGGRCHALFCDGSAKAFPKGTILKRHIWREMTP